MLPANALRGLAGLMHDRRVHGGGDQIADVGAIFHGDRDDFRHQGLRRHPRRRTDIIVADRHPLGREEIGIDHPPPGGLREFVEDRELDVLNKPRASAVDVPRGERQRLHTGNGREIDRRIIREDFPADLPEFQPNVIGLRDSERQPIGVGRPADMAPGLAIRDRPVGYDGRRPPAW